MRLWEVISELRLEEPQEGKFLNISLDEFTQLRVVKYPEISFESPESNRFAIFKF
jgi:hypothetical protein